MDDNAHSLMPSLHKDVETVLSGLAKISRLFVLKDREPVPEPSVLKWIEWYRQIEHRIVKYQPITLKDGQRGAVSTVFLGMSYGSSEGEPLLFETAVVVGNRILMSQKYPSWDAAEKGHLELMGAIADADRKKRSQE